jgi:hypothetical protein
VIEPLQDMPAGTLGFRASGRVSREQFREVLEPALRAAVDAGEVRMVFALGPGFERLELGALSEDVKAAITLGFAHLHAWKRAALVTDVELVAHAWHLTAWMTPIEVAVYDLDGLEDAKAWVAG